MAGRTDGKEFQELKAKVSGPDGLETKLDKLTKKFIWVSGIGLGIWLILNILANAVPIFHALSKVAIP